MAVFAMNYWEAYFLMVLEYRGLPWGSVGWNAAVSRAGPLNFHLCSLVSDWQHSSAWGPITPASASFITAPFPTLTPVSSFANTFVIGSVPIQCSE